MILHNYLQVHDNSTWSQIITANHVGLDDEIAAWQASHERVMCAECKARSPQVLYCVHTDRIAELDCMLAGDAYCEGSRGVSRAAGRRVGVMDMQRDRIADQLWREFMITHPDFDGILTDEFLRAD